MNESFRPKRESQKKSLGKMKAFVVGGGIGTAALLGIGLKESGRGKLETEQTAQEETVDAETNEIVRELNDVPIQGFDQRFFSKDQLKCLTDNVYHEARGEPLKGRYGVVFATLERVIDKKFPNSICGVVHQKWQFSWTEDKKILAAPINPKEYLQVALEVFELTQHRSLDEASVEAGLRAGLPRGSIYYKDAKFTGSERVQKFFATLHRVAQVGTHEFFVVSQTKNQKVAEAQKATNMVPIPRPRPKNI